MTANHLILDRAIATLESARAAKTSYFHSVNTWLVQHWIDGFGIGLACTGLTCAPEDRKAAIARRGFDCRSPEEIDDLIQRGVLDEVLADDMLALEIEMWRSARTRLLQIENG